MNYKVYLRKVDSSFFINVSDVETIQILDEAYFLYNAEGIIVFSAPTESVIGIEKN